MKNIKEFDVYSYEEKGRISGKYILIKLTSDNEQKKIIRVIKNLVCSHEEVLQKFLDVEIVDVDIKIECLGGGYLGVEQSIVCFWDSSYRYGEPPVDSVITILKNAFPDFEIKNKNPLN